MQPGESAVATNYAEAEYWLIEAAARASEGTMEDPNYNPGRDVAALTLFLALHLSVKPQLPWLIIDDPVQSMDEVHISQFAALLRTLSKQHGRQVIIAVHEKPLFDYLCLELSPAFEGDRLITVELGRSANGESVGSLHLMSRVMLTKEQMVRLRDEFGVYGIDTGRICVAALNSKNIDIVVDAIAKVL